MRKLRGDLSFSEPIARAGWLALLALVCVLWVRLASALPAIGDVVFESIESNEALIDGVVTAFAQDSQGFVWIGTPSGLIRYDGYRMRRFRNDPADPQSLGDDFVRALLPGSDGQMWVATATGGLSRFDPRTERFRQYRHRAEEPGSLAHDGVLALARADDTGAIWVGTVAGLDYLSADAEQFEHYRYAENDPTTINHNTIRSLLLDRRGDLWVGTRMGLSRRRAQSQVFERVNDSAGAPGSFAGQYIYSLFAASDGRIWIGTQAAGAAWIDPQDGQVQWLKLGEPNAGLSHPWVSDIAEPQPGELWLATYGMGIDVVDGANGQVIRRIRRDPAVLSSLAIDQVTTLKTDRSGLLWVGTWGGGAQRHNPTARAFQSLHASPTRAGALSDPTVLSVLERPDGLLWVGTAGNGIDVLDTKRGVISGYRADRVKAGALRDGTVVALAQTADGTAWVGTRQGGLHRFDTSSQSFRQIAGASASSDTRIGAILVSQSGRLWLTAESGLAEFDPASEKANRVAMEDGQAFVLPVSDMTEDAHGRLWVGTARGLLVYVPGSRGLRWVSLLDGATARTGIQALALDAQQTLWVFGQRGLLQANAANTELPQFSELVLSGQWGEANRFTDLMADATGRLWAQNVLIDPDAQRVVEFGRSEGADVGNISEGKPARMRDGTLLFGGTRGLLMVKPELYQPWGFAPPVLATAIEVDGRALPNTEFTQGVTLPSGGRRISVEFAALDYSAPLHNRYRYRLQGFDADWIETDAEHRVATYSNLWPGDYTLLLSGSNRSGAWSPQVLRMPLEVLPKYWQTPWFAGLLLALLGISAFAVYKLRTRQLLQRSHELARLVSERTHELETTNQALCASQDALRLSSRRAELIYKALNDALVGEVLDDKYRIAERIGSGGFGTVYRALQLQQNNVVALKVFKPVSGQEREQAIARFRSEGISAFKVQHLNAIKVIDFAIYLDAIVYLVMEFVEGVSLEVEMSTLGRCTPARMVAILAPVCDALAAAHAAGVVHRDVKPANILLDRSGGVETVKLIDFGIAKVLSGEHATKQALTATGLVIGTPGYMAPERLTARPYDGSSDVYSVGVLAFELLAGTRLFAHVGTDSVALAQSHINALPPTLGSQGVQVSAELEQLLMRALAKHPAHRPTAEAMARELRAADVSGQVTAISPAVRADFEASETTAAFVIVPAKNEP